MPKTGKPVQFHLCDYEPQLRELADGIRSTIEIGQELGMSAETVRRMLVALGLPRARPGGAPHRNRHWKGGRTVDKSGYILIHKPDHPHCDWAGRVREHRLVIESLLGRFLDPSEKVHHKNGDKGDNRPENLVLYACDADHKHHGHKGHVPNWSEDGLRRIREGIQKSVETRQRSDWDRAKAYRDAAIRRESKTYAPPLREWTDQTPIPPDILALRQRAMETSREWDHLEIAPTIPDQSTIPPGG